MGKSRKLDGRRYDDVLEEMVDGAGRDLHDTIRIDALDT